MRSFEVRCTLQGSPGRFRVHLGTPAPGHGRLDYQLGWLRVVLGGEVEAEVVERLEALDLGAAQGPQDTSWPAAAEGPDASPRSR